MRGKKTHPLNKPNRTIDPSRAQDVEYELLELAKQTTAQISDGVNGIPVIEISMPGTLIKRMAISLNQFKNATEGKKFVIRGEEIDSGEAESLYKKKDQFEALDIEYPLTSLKFEEELATVQTPNSAPRLFHAFLSLLTLNAETKLQPNLQSRESFQLVVDQLTQALVSYTELQTKTGWYSNDVLPIYRQVAEQQTMLAGASFMTQFTVKFHRDHPEHTPEIPAETLVKNLKEKVTKLATEKRFFMSARDRWELMKIADKYSAEVKQDLAQIIYDTEFVEDTRHYLHSARLCKTYEEWVVSTFAHNLGHYIVDWSGDRFEAEEGMIFAFRPESSKVKFSNLLNSWLLNKKLNRTEQELITKIKTAWDQN